MNNIEKLQQLTQMTRQEISDALDVASETVLAWENEAIMPAVSELEALSGIFSAQLDAKGIETQKIAHPIHIRLSVDYLLNLGITMSDWITLKWAFEGQWESDKLAVGFFDNNQLTRIVETESEFIAAFAGYLILQTDGEFEPYIDEFNDDKEYDWRLIRHSGETFTDVTRMLVTTELTEIKHG